MDRAGTNLAAVAARLNAPTRYPLARRIEALDPMPIDPPHLDIEPLITHDPRPLDLSPDEIRAVIHRAHEEEQLTLEQLLPYRAACAWRLTRALANLTGLVEAEELLADALADDRVWNTPRAARARAFTDPAVARALAALPSFALAPPDKDAPDLPHWIGLAQAVAGAMRLDRGSKLHPDAGRYGLAALLDTDTIHEAFPARAQVLEWEDYLVREAYEVLVTGGTQATLEWLRDAYALRSNEGIAIIARARQLAVTYASEALEESKALMVLRLDDIRRRARDALDITAELQTCKALAVVHGFGRMEPEDVFKDFAKVVAKVANDSPKRVFDAKASPATLTVDDEEREDG